MPEFVKPKRVVISPTEYVMSLIDAGLIKDLYDDEEICRCCAGTGIVISNNIYGLSKDPDRSIRFPYNHQALQFCPHCYNGIVHRCKLCGEIMPRGMLKHNCKQQQEIDAANRSAKVREEFANAPLASDEIVDELAFLYSDYYTWNNGYFDSWDEFFDNWKDNCAKDCGNEHIERPEYVWVTEAVEMKIDADSIVEQATEDLYEDAFYQISSKDTKELQDYLDDWCKRCGPGLTYYESHKYKVRIPWEKYDNDRCTH